MEYLQTLLNLINNGEEIDERQFPWPNEYYMLYILKQKFPTLTLDKLRQLLKEELALKNITLKEKVYERSNTSTFDMYG